MTERFDAVIVGAGPGGEVALNTLVKAGASVALVEREVIGGECTNWGCIPSKTLLRPTELVGKCERAAGVETPGLDFPRLSAYRDYMVSGHDDSKRVARYEERGVAVFKETGRIADPAGSPWATGLSRPPRSSSPRARRPSCRPCRASGRRASGRTARRPT